MENSRFQELSSYLAGKLSEPGSNWDEIAAALNNRYCLAEDDIENIRCMLQGTMLQCQAPPVSELEIFLTHGCSLRCSYCFVHKRDLIRDRLDEKMALKAIDFLVRESGDVVDLDVTFTGSEPLLALKEIEAITDYCFKLQKELPKRFHFYLTTNGTLITEEILSFCWARGVIVLVSLDRRRERNKFHVLENGRGTSTCDRVIDKISLLKRYQPWVGVRVTIHPESLNGLVGSVEELIEKGVNQFIIDLMSGVDYSDDELARYYETMVELGDLYRLKKQLGYQVHINLYEGLNSKDRNVWGCRAGRQSLMAAPDGRLYPCSRIYGNRQCGPELRLGTVDTGITEKETRQKLIQYLPEIFERRCFSCEIQKQCYGGCFAVNAEETGNFCTPSENQCRIMKAKMAVMERFG